MRAVAEVQLLPPVYKFFFFLAFRVHMPFLKNESEQNYVFFPPNKDDRPCLCDSYRERRSLLLLAVDPLRI